MKLLVPFLVCRTSIVLGAESPLVERESLGVHGQRGEI